MHNIVEIYSYLNKFELFANTYIFLSASIHKLQIKI